MTITCGKIDILPVRLDAAAPCINSVSLYFRAPCESYFHFHKVWTSIWPKINFRRFLFQRILTSVFTKYSFPGNQVTFWLRRVKRGLEILQNIPILKFQLSFRAEYNIMIFVVTKNSHTTVEKKGRKREKKREKCYSQERTVTAKNFA